MPAKSKKHEYSEAINKMLGLSGDLKVDFTKLKPDDLYSLYFYLKAKGQVEKESDGKETTPKGFLEGPFAKMVLKEIEGEDLDKLKERFPIVAKVASRVMEKR